MYISEITVKEHLKEMQQEVQMRRLAAELQLAQHPRHWAARVFALLRHRHQPETPELKVLPPAPQKANPPLRRAS